MALNNYQDADFQPTITPSSLSPTMGNYNSPKTFRFWCQKVLPLVYDNSLSYYELLCKVVDYLNKTMEDVNTAVQDVEELHGDFYSLQTYVNTNFQTLNTAFGLLQQYVNDYFNNLDVQEEINNKLDAMAADGSLDALILPYFNEYKEEINAEISRLNTGLIRETNSRSDADIVLQSQIDDLVSPSGEAPSAAEVTNARIGYNGYTYPSLGDAIRTQVSVLNDGLMPQLIDYPISELYYRLGNLSSTGSISESTNRIVTRYFCYAKAGTKFRMADGYDFRIAIYSALNIVDGNVESFTTESVGSFDSTKREYTFLTDCYFRIALRFTNAELTIAPEDVANAFVYFKSVLDTTSNVKKYDLLKNAKSTTGLMVKTDGTVGFGTNMKLTDFMPVSSDNIYLLKVSLEDSGTYTTQYTRLCEYDANKQFIQTASRFTFSTSTFTTGTYGYEYTPSLNAKYVRLSYGYTCIDEIEFSCVTAFDSEARQYEVKNEYNIKRLQDEKMSIKRNDKAFVDEIIDVAQSYADRDTMRYGTNTPLGSNYNGGKHIDCSTYIGFILRGIKYEDGPYVIDYPPEELNPYDTSQWVENSEYQWSINPAYYDQELYLDILNPDTAEARRASQLAMMFAEQGRQIPIDNHFANLEAGDLIFWSRKYANGEYVQPDRYRNITHVAMIIDKRKAPADAPWDVEQYPYQHTYIEVAYHNGGDPVGTNILETLDATDETINSLASFSFVTRPDLGSMKSAVFDGKKLIFNSDGTVTWANIT